jgi:hypothetical protein
MELWESQFFELYAGDFKEINKMEMTLKSKMLITEDGNIHNWKTQSVRRSNILQKFWSDCSS